MFPNDLGDASSTPGSLNPYLYAIRTGASQNFASSAVPPHVNVEWFVSVAGEEEKPERAAVRTVGLTRRILTAYMKGLPNPGFPIRLTITNEPRAFVT